ncbi:Elongator subunit elp6 [Podila epigama]|nr:Elongator subunit elp6 [Podila epigama]
MGYPSLESHLPSSHAPLLPPGIFLSISDTQASDGNFLLQHFISNYIKADQHVVLVGLAGILVHYTMVGRKLGVNLATARTKGNFHFVDGLTQLTDYAAPNNEYLPKPVATTPSSSNAPNTTSSASAAPKTSTTTTTTPRTGATAAAPPPPVLSYSPKLFDFYKSLENLIVNEVVKKSAPGSKKQLCLILDDLSVLLNCGWQCRDVLALVRYLKLLVAKHNGSLITLVHADGVLSEEVAQDGLVKGVFYEADYIIDVRGLDSGGSRDVHGQLSMLHGPGYLLKQRSGKVEENEWPALTLHYKILDNNVEVFAKGYSSEKHHRGESPARALDSAGYTALHYSSRAGNKKICALLLDAGAEVDERTPELGMTPLMRAIQQRHLDVARLLVSYGASLAMVNSDQQNVFHILAIAASAVDGKEDGDQTTAIAKWLLTRLNKDQQVTMLSAVDAKGHRPMDLCSNSLGALLTPPNT